MKKLALVLVVFVLACGDSTGPEYPDLRGSYVATWEAEFTYTATGQKYTYSCSNGSLSITTQKEGDFSGSLVLPGDFVECDEMKSGTLQGKVRLDGGLDFSVEIPGSGSSFGCDVVDADSGFNGAFASNRILASFRATIDCYDQYGYAYRYRLVVEVTATKS